MLITGGGGGIGFEATRAFSYMGAKVIVAEIDADKGAKTQNLINEEFNNDNVDFYQIDISDEKQMGLPAESFQKHLETLQKQIQNHQWENFLDKKDMFVKLQRFYEHQIKQLQGYEKDVAQLESSIKLLKSWIDIQNIIDIL